MTVAVATKPKTKTGGIPSPVDDPEYVKARAEAVRENGKLDELKAECQIRSKRANETGTPIDTVDASSAERKYDEQWPKVGEAERIQDDAFQAAIHRVVVLVRPQYVEYVRSVIERAEALQSACDKLGMFGVELSKKQIVSSELPPVGLPAAGRVSTPMAGSSAPVEHDSDLMRAVNYFRELYPEVDETK